MLICGFDLETTGFDPVQDQITEIGAVLWDTETARPVQLYNELVRLERPVEISALVTQKTGITNALLNAHGVPLEQAVGGALNLIQSGEAIVAHNGHDFDFKFWKSTMDRLHLASFPPDCLKVDTTTDVPYPPEITTRNLVHLAAEHGFCNPFTHRALFDTLTMLHVMSRYPIETVLALAREPLMVLVALVEYSERDKAKVRGYHWNGENRTWSKRLKYSQVEKEEQECGFLVQRIVETT